MREKETTVDLSELATSWPSPIIARSEIARFTGGLLCGRTLANLDSLGKGPGRIRIGRKVCYRVNSFVEWLEKRAVAA